MGLIDLRRESVEESDGVLLPRQIVYELEDGSYLWDYSSFL